MSPTLFTGVRNDMRIARQEIFGPVASVIPFDGADEAVAIANDTIYGLAAGVWTRDVDTAFRLVREIEAGVIWINSFDEGDMTQPFGGYKQSGNARDKCFDSIKSYTQTKSAWFRLARPWPRPRASRTAMHDDLIGYERRGALAVLTLNRPDKLNAINTAMIDGLHRALDTAEADDGVRVVVVAGAGRAFSSGFDLDMETGGEGRPDPLAVRRALENDFRIIMRFWDCPKVTIAAVHRYCLGSAMELALACDLTVAADDCMFGAPEVRFGSGIVAMLLPWLAGPKRAKQLLLTGEDRVPAAQALQMGLVSQVVPADRLMDEALELGRRIAANDRLAVKLTKQAINRSLDVAGMRQALLAGARARRDHRDDGNRRITRIQRDPEARRRQGGDRLAERAGRTTDNGKNNMNKRRPVGRKSCAHSWSDIPRRRSSSCCSPTCSACCAASASCAASSRSPSRTASISAVRPCCSTARARPSSASTTAVATAIPT